MSNSIRNNLARAALAELVLELREPGQETALASASFAIADAVIAATPALSEGDALTENNMAAACVAPLMSYVRGPSVPDRAARVASLAWAIGAKMYAEITEEDAPAGAGGLVADIGGATATNLGSTYFAQDTQQLFESVEYSPGLFRWVEVSIGPPSAASWSSQADWWIDPVNGVDTNDGSQAAPIRTLTQWFRRVSINGVQVAMTLHLLPPPLGVWPVNDSPEGTLKSAPSAGVTVLGAAAVTLIRNGVFSASTPYVAATNTERRATDSLGRAWPIDPTGQRIRNTTVGANLNSTCWPDSDVGAGVATLSEPVDVTIGLYYLSALRAIVVNDTYALEQLPTLPRWGIAIPNGSLYFSDVDLSNTSSFNASYLEFAKCDLGFVGLNSVTSTNAYWVAANCRLEGFCTISSGTLVAGVAIGGFVSIAGPDAFLDQRFKVKDGTVFYGGNPGGNAQQIASVQVFSTGSDPGISFYQGAMPYFPSVGIFSNREIVGSGSTAYGIACYGGAMPEFEGNVNGFYLTGALGNVGIGTPRFLRTYAQLPYIRSDIAAGSGTAIAGFTLRG